jgi:hypothetical protein
MQKSTILPALKIYFQFSKNMTCERSVNNRHFIFEMLEITFSRLVNQCSSIRQKQDAFLRSTFPQSVNDLKRRVGFARPRCHDEDKAILSFGNRFDGSIDGNLLIIAWFSARPIEKIVLGDDFLSFGRRDAFVFFVFFPEFFGRWKIFHCQFCFNIIARCRSVVEQKTVAIAAKNARNV